MAGGSSVGEILPLQEEPVPTGEAGGSCWVMGVSVLTLLSLPDFLLLCGSGILHPPSPCSASPGAPHLGSDSARRRGNGRAGAGVEGSAEAAVGRC